MVTGILGWDLKQGMYVFLAIPPPANRLPRMSQCRNICLCKLCDMLNVTDQLFIAPIVIRYFHRSINIYVHNMYLWIQCPLHPGRLTWNLQITHLERKMIFQTSMIMFHVNLRGCTLNGSFPLTTRWIWQILRGWWGCPQGETVQFNYRSMLGSHHVA